MAYTVVWSPEAAKLIAEADSLDTLEFPTWEEAERNLAAYPGKTFPRAELFVRETTEKDKRDLEEIRRLVADI
jgi:hypothetical protein